MATLYAQDDKNTLIMKTGTLPHSDVARVVTRSPTCQMESAYSFGSGDCHHAWQITAEAQRLAAYHGYRPGNLALETFVIDRPSDPEKSGRLGLLWLNEPPSSDYRVLIHRQATQYQDKLFHEDLWSDAWSKHLSPNPTEDADTVTRSGKGLLNDLLKAYSDSHGALRQVMKDTGHHYALSHGFLCHNEVVPDAIHEVTRHPSSHVNNGIPADGFPAAPPGRLRYTRIDLAASETRFAILERPLASDRIEVCLLYPDQTDDSFSVPVDDVEKRLRAANVLHRSLDATTSVKAYDHALTLLCRSDRTEGHA